MNVQFKSYIGNKSSNISLQITGLSKGRFESLKDEFLQRGLMTNELLSYCLQHFNLNIESQETFMDLMLKFDLCYQVNALMFDTSSFIY